MTDHWSWFTRPRRALVGLVTACAAVLAAPAALADEGTAAPARKAPAKAPTVRSRYVPDRFAGKAGRYYRAVWGVEDLRVKLVESGQLVRFDWRVLDAARAAPLGDKRLEPALVDPAAGVSLVVPAMEKIGKLRQGTAPEAGKSYWMTFSNKGRRVKRGDRVNVVIGTFHADGLVVD